MDYSTRKKCFFAAVLIFVHFRSSLGRPCKKHPFVSKVIGGVSANPGEFPYQVALQLYDRLAFDYYTVCGGAILNPTTILTAAHCFEDQDPNSIYRIVAGEHDTSIQEGFEQERILEHVLIHGGFDGGVTYRNDIALAFISSDDPLKFNEVVGAVSLPSREYEELTGSGVVAGWGVTSEWRSSSTLGSDTLNKVRLPFQLDKTCNDIWGERFIQGKMLCAGSLKGGNDACAGDSGGPIVLSGGDKVVVGVVSFGIGCGRKNLPGVYVRVSNYVDWIHHVIKKFKSKAVSHSELPEVIEGH